MPTKELTPEEIQRLNESPERRRLLNERIARARAMGQAPQKFDTWGGALLGGLGDVFTNIASKRDEDRAREELDAETKSASETRGRLLRSAFEAMEEDSGNSSERKWSPDSTYPPSRPTDGSADGNTGGVPYYIGRPNPEGLASRMIEANRPTPAEHTQAGDAAQQRNPGRMASMLAMSGDPMLERLATLQMEMRRRQQERQQHLDDYARTRGDKQADTLSQRAYESVEHQKDRESRERAASLERAMDRWTHIEARGARETATQERKQDRDDARFEKDVQGAGKDLQDLSDLVGDVNFLGKLASQEGDLPGLGSWDSRKPAFMRSDDDAQVRQRIDRLLGQQIKATTGATATPQEMERIANSYGLGSTAEGQSKLGLQKLVEDTKRALATRQARFRPEVLDEFKKRGGVLASDVGAPEAAPVGDKILEVGGKRYKRGPNGEAIPL